MLYLISWRRKLNFRGKKYPGVLCAPSKWKREEGNLGGAGEVLCAGSDVNSKGVLGLEREDD